MEPIYLRPESESDESSNGGLVTLDSFVSGLKGDCIPDVSVEESLAGLVRYRKIFVALTEKVPSLRHYVDRPTEGYDSVLIAAGSSTDTQGAITGVAMPWKGSGVLTSISSPTGMEGWTLEVNSENEGLGFSLLDLVRISDGAAEDFVRVDSVAWNGSVATLHAPSGCNVQNNYTAGAYVSSCIEKGECSQSVIWVKDTVPVSCPSKTNNEIKLRTVL